MIIDCHTHIAPELTGFWKPLRFGKVEDQGLARQAFPPSFDPVNSRPEVLLGYLDQAGIDRAYLVQHHLYGDQNKSVLSSIKRWPDRFRGFAYLGDFTGPDLPDRLERLIEAGMSGLKVELDTTRRLRADFRFDGESEYRVWQRLNLLGRPLVLDINPATTEDVVAITRLLDEFTRIRLVICHLGWPVLEGWKERAQIARHPRGWVDVASIAGIFGQEEEYPFPRAQELVRWAVETFGAEKVMWGTDYPGALNRATYPQQVNFIRNHCDFLSTEQKDELLCGAALRLLGEKS